MSKKSFTKKTSYEFPFPSSREELQESEKDHTPDLMHSKPAFLDSDFLLRRELRPVRLQLELLKPELLQQDEGVDATIVFFGSARIPSEEEGMRAVEDAQVALAEEPDNVVLQNKLLVAERLAKLSVYNEHARRLAQIVNEQRRELENCPRLFVSTGGGPGIMEAANKGAHEVGAKSLGLGIVIPHEQIPNKYVTPELSFPFHYFAIRKMHFLIRAKALVAFPGGFGTLDEIFDALTLMQTGKMKRIPLILFGREYWNDIVDFDALVNHATIDKEDLDLIDFVETPEEAWQIILDFYEWDR